MDKTDKTFVQAIVERLVGKQLTIDAGKGPAHALIYQIGKDVQQGYFLVLMDIHGRTRSLLLEFFWTLLDRGDARIGEATAFHQRS